MNPRLANILSRSEAAVTAWNRFAFRRRHGRWPNDPPRTFNDHIFHVKTREALDPLRVFVADKALVKLYLRATIGDKHVVPTLALYDDEVTMRAGLARGHAVRSVVKPTHSSGLVLFADGPMEPSDMEIAARWFRESLFTRTGERLYRHLRPRVIVEPFLDLERTGHRPRDFKIFCGRGRPVYVSVDHWHEPNGNDPLRHRSRSFYAPDWTPLPFRMELPVAPLEPAPPMLERMLAIASAIARDFSSIRVDFYASEDRCLVGELTNTAGNASIRFLPDQRADDLLGRAISDPALDVAALAHALATPPQTAATLAGATDAASRLGTAREGSDGGLNESLNRVGARP